MSRKDNPKSPITDKRPNAKDYTKWETRLPDNLEDFMNHYVKWRLDGEEPDEWKAQIVADFETELKEMIRVHWKASSKTRKLFISMNKEDVWADFKALDMNLTKRNLATLDPKFIPELDSHILTKMKSLVEEVRHEMHSILDATYASEEERGEVTPLTSGTECDNYFLDSYKQHLDMRETLREEFKAKFGPIESLRQRELWVQNLVKFEVEYKAPRQSKGKQDFANWIPKFRQSAAKHLANANKMGIDVIEKYESATGKKFLLLGEDYRTDYLEKQLAQVAKVKTNFTQLTDDILFFDNPGGGPEGAPVCQKVFDPSLEHMMDAAVPVQEPPAMPTCSDELKFTFEYY